MYIYLLSVYTEKRYFDLGYAKDLILNFCNTNKFIFACLFPEFVLLACCKDLESHVFLRSLWVKWLKRSPGKLGLILSWVILKPCKQLLLLLNVSIKELRRG